MPDRFACTAPLLGGKDGKNVRDEVVDFVSRCLPFVSIVASEGDSSDKFGVQCVALNADLTDPDVTNAIATELRTQRMSRRDRERWLLFEPKIRSPSQ